MTSAHFRVARSFAGVLGRRAAVEPGFGIVSLFLLVPAGEEAIQVFSVLEVITQHGRGIGVPGHVLTEIFVVAENVVDEAT